MFGRGESKIGFKKFVAVGLAEVKASRAQPRKRELKAHQIRLIEGSGNRQEIKVA
jgi:hypothetical protein